MSDARSEPAAGDARKAPAGRRRFAREGLRQLVILLATLATVEAALRIADPAYLRSDDWGSYHYRYDAELGWSPVPNDRMHNSLGLRDIEPEEGTRPAILFLGDSQVWGANVEAHERFSDRLRTQMPGFRVVNAGVAGYGTDQEYLLLQRLWDRIRPAVVVVMFECNNDRLDNSSNVRYFSYKPYAEITPAGRVRIAGLPPPRSRRLVFRDNVFARHSWLGRLAVSAFVEIRHPRLRLSDPTEPLIGAVRAFAEARGARLLLGLQREEPQLEAYLKTEGIPYARFDGAEEDSSRHWTPAGHAAVAERLKALFAETGVVNARSAP